MDKILVTRSSMPSFDEYIEEIRPVFESHWLTNMGVKHEQLRAELKDYLKVGGVEVLTNGHMALELTLQAMKLSGEIITTPFTFASTTHAISRCGLTPVFCDVNPDDYTMDVDKIEELITDKTCAIMPVHVYGHICNIEAIEEIAKKHNLKVIYDAAHTFGEEYKGRGVGSYGDASIFSFHATKVFNTIEGGAVATADEELLKQIYLLKDFGILDEETNVAIGCNAKMNEFCAAMGLCNLRHVDEEIAKRKAVVDCYRENLSGIAGIKFIEEKPDLISNYAYFPVVFTKEFKKTRDQIHEELLSEGIGSRKYFYPITNALEAYADKYDSTSTPVALELSLQVLTLPLYADLGMEDVVRICNIIKR